MLIAKISKQMMNKYGDNGSPCLTPLRTLNGAVVSLSMGTHGLRFLRDFFANLRFLQEDLRFSD